MISLLYQAYGIEWTAVIQKTIADWVIRTFGLQCFTTRKERALRVLEEALELAQSCGISLDEADGVLMHVYSRPEGEVRQELAGVAVTALAFAESQNFNLAEIVAEEVTRVLAKDIDELRKKHQQKKEAGISMGGTKPNA
jgi:hypothetical protein